MSEKRKLDQASPALQRGDWYCSVPSSNSVTKAIDDKKSAAGIVAGIALMQAIPGQDFEVQENGIVPAAITGLGAGSAGLVVINNNAKAVRTSFAPGGYIGGIVDTTGSITILPQRLSSVSPVLNIMAAPFNAVADSDLQGGGTDASAAIQAAINSLDSLAGGIVEIPFGKYRIAKPVIIKRAGVTLHGHGGDIFDSSTLLVADRGVTPIEVGTGGDGTDGGHDAKIENIAIRSASKNKSVVTGGPYVIGEEETQPPFSRFKIPLSTPADFKDGQVIRIAGCGNPIQLSGVQAVVASLSNIVKITQANGGPFPIPNGAYIIIPGAFNKPTKVIDRPGGKDIYTMESNSENHDIVTSFSVRYVIDHYAKIMSGGGTTALTVDSANFGGISVEKIDVYHGDCGILVHSRCVIENVSIGLDDHVHDFTGYGICVDCSHGNTPSSWDNGGRVINYFSYGNQGAIRYTGVDANACVNDQILVIGQENFGIVESSFLGNYYYGIQLTGGYGVLCYKVGTNASVFCGSYFEDGTIGSLGDGCISIGGHMPQSMGGTSYHSSAASSTFNRLLVGGIDGLMFNYSVEMEPWAPGGGGYFWALTASKTAEVGGSEKSLVFRMSLEGDAGTKGYFMWQHSGASRKIPYCISDSATGLSTTPGELWIPRGFWIGWNGISDLMTESMARHIWQDVVNPVALNKQNRVGNIQFFGDSIPGGYLGWVCTTAGTPGEHVTFGQIMDHDLLVRSVSTGVLELTEKECAHKIIRLEGSLQGNVTIIVKTPAQFIDNTNGPAPNTWDKIFHNDTSGQFIVTIKAVAGDIGVNVPQTKSQYLWSDGLKVIPAGSSA